MDMILYHEALKAAFLPYIKSIQEFHFYWNNLLFWAGFLVLYLILEIFRNWSSSKAFFFCAIVASILLSTTWIERPLIDMFTVQGHSCFDPFILKAGSITVISVVVLYFVFVDNS